MLPPKHGILLTVHIELFRMLSPCPSLSSFYLIRKLFRVGRIRFYPISRNITLSAFIIKMMLISILKPNIFMLAVNFVPSSVTAKFYIIDIVSCNEIFVYYFSFFSVHLIG